MTTLEIWLMGVALAMDCFSVSLASGAILRKFLWRTILTMAFFFGFFQGLMPCIGWVLTSNFQQELEAYDHWIAFALLLYLGVSMIRESFSDEEEKTFNPQKIKVILTLSVATSIDALAVGISFSCLGYDTMTDLMFPLAVIGVASFLFSIIGATLGIRLGNAVSRKLRPELLGGIILLAIGIRILTEHLL